MTTMVECSNQKWSNVVVSERPSAEVRFIIQLRRKRIICCLISATNVVRPSYLSPTFPSAASSMAGSALTISPYKEELAETRNWAKISWSLYFLIDSFSSRLQVSLSASRQWVAAGSFINWPQLKCTNLRKRSQKNRLFLLHSSSKLLFCHNRTIIHKNIIIWSQVTTLVIQFHLSKETLWSYCLSRRQRVIVRVFQEGEKWRGHLNWPSVKLKNFRPAKDTNRRKTST